MFLCNKEWNFILFLSFFLSFFLSCFFSICFTLSLFYLFLYPLSLLSLSLPSLPFLFNLISHLLSRYEYLFKSPEQNSISDLIVEVGSVVLQWQQVLQLDHLAQVGVDPVGEGALLLTKDHVVAVTVLACKTKAVTSSASMI